MATTELPTTFGKYFLTDKLATGGMAEIFLGKLIGPGGFEKQLVIKQIRPALSGQRRFVDLFVAEAKTLVSLAHGNIVPVYELGVVDDTYFIAMEYIDGATLHQVTEARLAAGGALPPALAGWITAEVARGLDYAHRKGTGVVHRDLSPRNVMLSRDGEVKLVDFGIAVDPGAVEARGDDDRMPTGSFAYMSPEQVARRPLTGQSDLFSLGVLAWEMLAGARLFARATAEDTLAAVCEAPLAPPSSRRPEVPARLDELVMRALERDPARRWQSAAELLVPLQRYLFSLTTTPGPREVAALVATSCPPRGRSRDQPGPVTRTAPPPGGEASGEVAEGERGPTTRPMAERTRRRRPSVREATFATHVDLERVLGATPPTDAPATTQRVAPRRASGGGRGRIAAVVVAAAALTAAMIVLRPCAPPAAPRVAALALDAAALAPPIAVDASSPDAVDAGAAVPSSPVDAGVAVAPPSGAGAGTGRRPPPDDRRAARTGVLRVGADPWGDVYIDGRLQGRAPGQWTLRAGSHTVEVVFPSEHGELRRRFSVQLAAGGESRLFADFRAGGSAPP